MLKKMMSSPRGLMILFVLLVNLLSGLVTVFFWFLLSDSLPIISFRPFGGLIPMTTTIILAGLFSSIFSKRATKPIRDMINATKVIADGDYSVRVDESGSGEINELSHSFNQMTAELGSTELMRTDFINTFSHEFKTPIVSIRGFAKRLRNGGLSEDKQNEYLDYIVSESERLSELSNNVLLLSKYENQQLISDKTDYELGEQLRRCILLLEKQWESKNITFDLDIPDNIPYRNNEEMLDHVWLNLIGNAVKFSHQDGTITVTAESTDSQIQVAITDNGIGMSEETSSHIFDKFYQGDETHASAGNGLGLSLVKRIMQLCDGEVSVKSIVGEGTTFLVTLPKTL